MKNFSSKTRASYRRNSNKKKILRIGASIGAALIVLYLLGAIIGGLFSYVVKPIYTVRDWFVNSTDTVPMYFKERGMLIDQIRSLEEERSARSGSAATIVRITQENDELRKLLGADNEQRTAAGVVARPPYLPYDALLIDRGSNQGIQERAVVYHFNNQAIGFISRVYAESALVTLFSAPDVESTVYILGPNIYTTAYGMGGGVVRVSVPQGIELSEKDVVLLPTLEVGLLGQVHTVQSVSTQPEQHGFLSYEVPLQSIHLVSVSNKVFEEVSFAEAQEAVASLSQEMLKVDIPEDYQLEVASSTATTTVTATSTDLSDSE